MRISDWSSDVCSSDLVGDNVNLPRIGAIDIDQHVAGLVGHDDHPRRCGNDILHDAALRRGRPIENRVQGGDERRLEPRYEAENQRACLAAEDAELMLEADEIERLAIDELGGSRKSVVEGKSG